MAVFNFFNFLTPLGLSWWVYSFLLPLHCFSYHFLISAYESFILYPLISRDK